MNPEKVTSQEAFLELLAALESECNAKKQEAREKAGVRIGGDCPPLPASLDLTNFLAGMHVHVQAHCYLKKPLEPSWQTFAVLLRAGWVNHV